ncbi:Uncharacterized protein FWK35_00009902 [Aphis craccivora]|uniref:Zinc finger MYM-type protein 1-like n=1 Tax=Aphis craccivora TaxID=307492 RepID=A0A6G0YA22_APHCR|nr:Uncharacterized protein FWK35_00009902 [Aphis craccivora]
MCCNKFYVMEFTDFMAIRQNALNQYSGNYMITLMKKLTAQTYSTATDELLFNSLIKTFTDRKIPLNNIIGFESDGCNVMMGRANKVASRSVNYALKL